jgi:hypothetical protein
MNIFQAIYTLMTQQPISMSIYGLLCVVFGWALNDFARGRGFDMTRAILFAVLLLSELQILNTPISIEFRVTILLFLFGSVLKDINPELIASIIRPTTKSK